MASTARPNYAISQNGYYILAKSPNVGITLVTGNTVPTDATAGFAPGCVFLQTDGSDDTVIYVNEGTASSCDFNALFPGLTVTAAELNLLSGLLATSTEINQAADMSTRIVNVTATPLAMSVALHHNKLLVLDKADGLAITLPEANAAAAGFHCEMLVKTTFTSASTIKSSRGTDVMIGHAIMGNNTDNTVVNFQAVAGSTLDTIDLLGTSNSTGGMAGQRMVFDCLAANLWSVLIIGDAAGTEATPFADTVA